MYKFHSKIILQVPVTIISRDEILCRHQDLNPWRQNGTNEPAHCDDEQLEAEVNEKCWAATLRQLAHKQNDFFPFSFYFLSLSSFSFSQNGQFLFSTRTQKFFNYYEQDFEARHSGF